MKVAVRRLQQHRPDWAPAAADRVESMLPDDMSYLAAPLVVVSLILSQSGFYVRYLIMLCGILGFIAFQWYNNDF